MDLNFSDILYEFTFGLFEKLIGFTNVLYKFLFYEVWEGVSLWQIIGGVGLLAILIVQVVKLFV